MGGTWAALLLEFRYWRASAPVGVLIGFAVGLWTLVRWPIVADPRGLLGEPVYAAFSGLTIGVWWVLAFVACLLMGGWWCNVALGIVSRVQLGALAILPLNRDFRSWGRFHQWMLPISPWELERLQRDLRATPEFSDLESRDRVGAYRGFLKEALTVPLSALGLNATTNAEVLRSLTDLRLTAGIVPWLPIAISGLAMHVKAAVPDLAYWLNSLAVLSAILVMLTLAVQARNCADLVTSGASTTDRLARHSRLAVDSGRRLTDIRSAQDSIH